MQICDWPSSRITHAERLRGDATTLYQLTSSLSGLTLVSSSECAILGYNGQTIGWGRLCQLPTIVE